MSNKRSRKLEEKTAKDFSGGRATINSGALPFWKNDIHADNFIIEHKYTEAKSYSIKKAYFKSITEEAFKLGKLPMMVIEFVDRPELRLAVIRYEDAVALDCYLKETYGIESEGACKEE